MIKRSNGRLIYYKKLYEELKIKIIRLNKRLKKKIIKKIIKIIGLYKELIIYIKELIIYINKLIIYIKELIIFIKLLITDIFKSIYLWSLYFSVEIKFHPGIVAFLLVIVQRLFIILLVISQIESGQFILDFILQNYNNELDIHNEYYDFWYNKIDNITTEININSSNNLITSGLPSSNWSIPLVPTGGPGGPPGNNSTGLLATPDVENSRKNYENHKFNIYKRKFVPIGPRYKYLYTSSDGENKWIYPERYHTKEAIHSIFSNTLRIYDESGIRYAYHTENFYLKNRYCIITYPDATKLTVFNKKIIIEHIKFHRKHISMSYSMKPAFMYPKEYHDHFEPFRKAKINAILENKNDEFKRKKITINELLNF